MAVAAMNYQERVNVGRVERWLSMVAGGALAAYALSLRLTRCVSAPIGSTSRSRRLIRIRFLRAGTSRRKLRSSPHSPFDEFSSMPSTRPEFTRSVSWDDQPCSTTNHRSPSRSSTNAD